MAAQVNKKFVIILSAAIAVLVLAAGGAGLFAIKNSGDRHAKRAEKLVAEGKIEDAYFAISRAVAKDQTNVPWLIMYRDLARQTVPKTREELEKRYRLYLGTLRNLSVAQPNNPDALLEFIEERHGRLERTGWNSDANKEFIDEVNSMSATLARNEPDSEAMQTVRWYLAQARVELARRSPVDEIDRQKNLTALTEIVQKNPDDVDAMIYLAMWHMDEANQFYRSGLKQQEEEQRAEADRLFKEIVVKFPDSLFGRFMDLARRQVDIARTVTEPGARRRAIEALAPEAGEAIAVFNNMKTEDIDLRLFEAARTILPRILGTEASKQMLPMGERIYLKNPEKPWIALTYARMLMDAEQFDKAVAVLDGVLTQQKMAVSLEAMLQPIAQVSAFAERVDAALFAAERSDDRSEWIARADRYMKEFEQAASADDQGSVRLRRAKVAMMKNNFASAIRDLSELEQIGLAEAPEVKYMLAVALHKQENFSGARDKLQQLIDNGNISIQAISLLADTQMRLSDFDAAEKTLKDAIRIFPNATESFESRLTNVLAAKGETVDLDPVTKVMFIARKARIDGDFETARNSIKEGLAKNPENERLTEELIQIELAANDRPEAKRLADAAIAKWPDNNRFKELEIFARVENQDQAMLEWIEMSPGTEVEKSLRRYAVYARQGDTAAAERQLELAEKTEPDNAIVLNERFSRALAANDFEKARQYATKAASLNLDNLDGALFQGRLELARGDAASAVSTFRGATKKVPHSPGAWSLLGDAQIAAGQIDGAVESYNQAIELRQGDTEIAQRYARALLRVGRGPEALAVLDDLLKITPQRGEVYDLWITLQGAYGDREEALAQRATRFERDPAESQNAVAYFALLIEDSQWERAEQVLSQIRNNDGISKITVIDMEAKLLAGMGSVLPDGKKDLSAGRKVYDEYLANLANNATSSDFIAYGQFLERYGYSDDALATYRKAQERQTDGQFDADVALANTLINRANELGNRADALRSSGGTAMADTLSEQRKTMLQDAAAAMRRIINANGDSTENGLPVHRSYAVVLADLEQYDEAEKIITKVAAASSEKNNDLQIMLIRARIAAAKNDLREARRLLDQAAEKYPGNYEPFWQRARLNRQDPALAASVHRDLNKVTQLRPAMTEAWGFWFDLFRSQKRENDAIASLRTGVAANPAVRELRQFLIFQLLEMNRTAEAQQVAVEGTRQNSDKAFWLRTSAELYARSELWQQAMPLYEQLYAIDNSNDNLVSYIDTVLRQPNPNRGTVQQLLGALPPDDQMDLRTVMVTARARAFFNQKDRSQKLSQRGFVLAGDDWRAMSYWLGQASLAEGGIGNAIKLADSFKPTLEVAIPLAILGGNQLMAAGEKPANVLSRLTALDAIQLDPVSRFELLRLKAKLFYLDGPMQDYEKSAELNKQALEINSNSLDVNNDLAFTLAQNLNRPAEGLPYAERAASLAPDTSTVLDTLGWVYFALGRHQDAVATLQRAADRAQGRDNSEEFIAIVHLGIVKVKMGDRRAGEDLYKRAETLLRLDPTIKNYYPTAIDELKMVLN